MRADAAPRFLLDRRAVRRSFDRAATGYDGAAILQHEVGVRMAERLDYVKIDPLLLLDAGCGTGEAEKALQKRYPKAEIVAVDFAHRMLTTARAKHGQRRSLFSRFRGPLLSRWNQERHAPRWLCADFEKLPLKSNAIDLVFSNLALQWVDAPATTFAEWQRVLKVDGLLMFTTFGPDTLTEIRAAFATVDDHLHTSRFIDMHDVGDALVHAGFADPVIDMERMTLTYDDPVAMMRELKAIGAHNAARERPRGLTGKAHWRGVLDALEEKRIEGRIRATFEVIYGHAWKVAPRTTDDGRAIMRFDRSRGQHTSS